MPTGSQLCREESWEIAHHPPEAECLQKPPPLYRNSSRSGDTLYTSLKDKAHALYSDLKDRYNTRRTLCKLRGRDLQCASLYNNYFFQSKAVILILLMNALFSLSMYGITFKISQYILGPNRHLSTVTMTYGTVFLLFPVIAHLSDAYVRKHTMVEVSIWLAWVAFGVLGVALSVQGYSNTLITVNRYAILPSVFLILSISYVCFMSNIIPFALDQLQGASHVHYSSFFYWWYWTFSIGVALIGTPEFCSEELELRMLIHVEIALVCIAAMLILDILLKHWFVIEPHCSKQPNPILQVCQVLCYALRPPPNQRIPSVVHHELDFSSRNRLELAKRRFGGRFETEQVEDARTFLYVMLMLATMGLLVVVYFGVSLLQNDMLSPSVTNNEDVGLHKIDLSAIMKFQ